MISNASVYSAMRHHIILPFFYNTLTASFGTGGYVAVLLHP